MFILKDPNKKFPELYPRVIRGKKTANKWEPDIVGDFVLRKGIDIIPLEGLQEQVIKCNANLIFACGAATMGKTYSGDLKALNGLGLPEYSASLISFRLQDVKKGTSILRDANAIYGNFSNCESSTSDYPLFYWSKWNNSIQLRHSNFNISNPKEYEEFKDYAKKVQSSYMYIDEVTEMKDIRMLFYWFSRNRDSSGMKPCIYCTFNPEHEHWTTQMLVDAGYMLPNWTLNPQMFGEIRYFYVGGKGESASDIIWGKTKEEIYERANIKLTKKEIDSELTIDDMIKSFTVFSGEAADNKELVSATGGQSIANLHIGGTNRAVLKEAYFGYIENEELTVSRQMIHNLWINPKDADNTMYATMDISGGGEKSDNCPLVIWRGLDIITIKFFRGDVKEINNWIMAQLNEYKVPIRNFAYDATGMGYFFKVFNDGVGVTANRRVIPEYDEAGNKVEKELYYNLRSQLIGKTKVMLEMDEMSCSVDKNIIVQYGKKNEQRRLLDILFDEINLFRATSRSKKIYYRNKDEYKDKFKSSPDLMDTIVLRAIFELDGKDRKTAPEPIPETAYNGIGRRFTGGYIGKRISV